MDGVFPVTGVPFVRRDSIQSEISVESDVTYRSLENGDISAMVGGPHKLTNAEMLSSMGGSTRSLVSIADQGGSGGAMLSEANSRVVFVNDAVKNQLAGFCGNKVANFYFLLVGGGQIIPAISSTSGIPYQWIVLLIVLSIDAVFAAIEDSARHRADDKMNARVTQVFDPNEPTCFRETIWRDVKVGDFLKVSNYEAIPADILLLAVSEPDPNAPAGICFVETKSLDGETNLKVSQALSCTFSQLSDPRFLGNLPGKVICERPNHDVNNFSGRLEPQQGHTIPIDLKNIALRGCVIRNTPYVYGLVLNTGSDTKIMQSASETPTKVSKILTIVNRGIGILMAILIALCVLGAVMCSAWVANNTTTVPHISCWFIYMGYYWILIASFVPITLYVTIAIVKSYQTFFLNRDMEMYDEVTDTPALVRNADLNDDLGQVTHIFSDKTGTLTANEMDFRKMSINGVSYGRGTTEIGREAVRCLGKDLSASGILADNTPVDAKEDNVRFIDPANEYLRDSDPRLNPIQAAWIEAFLTHLAVCHSVVLEQGEDGLGTQFSASSPDELALVSGANFFGYSFKARKNGSVSIRIPGQSQELTFELLEMIDFTSTRKRMSVVVRNPEKKVLLLSRSPTSISNDMLLGATAIEDRLQDNVTSTIADLSRAGIKIWILTGDKEETAINIGFACQLLNNDMERLIINTETFPTAAKLYDMLLFRCKEVRKLKKESIASASRSQAIIIDGKSLTMVFSHHTLCDLFLEVSQHCSAVICCRVSPKQKAQVVRLYKTNIQGCRSLSIGDSANDVGMIQKAHIGVGISGHEGMQAVNASDFAIAQFRFLKRLLLVHGHWNYRRMAKLALYVVYKNIILYCTEFVLGTISGGSGMLYFSNMWVNGYNVFWTSLPIAIVGILEQECLSYIAEKYPGLYYAGAQGEQFSLRIFVQWILEGLYEGVVCVLVPAFLVGYVDSNGNSFSRDACGGLSYCCLIMVGWAKLTLNIVTWNYVTLAGFAFSFSFWFFAAFVISVYLPTFAADVAFPYIYGLPEFYLIIYLSMLLCLGRDFLFKAYKREMKPEYYHILQELNLRKLNPEKAQWEPPELRYRPFQADLTEEKPQFELVPEASQSASPQMFDCQRAYTGFAFSTQVLEDRFINPLREMVMPVNRMANAIGNKLGGIIHKDADDEPAKSFEERIKELPMEDQVVYEIQRFQVFAGWGSSLPGHLFITDPPHLTNAEMNDGSSTFDLTDWIVDNTFGGQDQWQYGTKFKDFCATKKHGTCP
ncbi:Phospholipid-transporting atpase, partial [Globisporangium splendens]